ncbi:MAG: hypothetical protein P4L03_07940 [Terracidiphilus sp.]|nr:hypothetical protein [Terracidiphilus sp.]
MASMKMAARFALLVLASASAPLFCAENPAPAAPPAVQHFGPLVVVATHDESPGPATLAIHKDAYSKAEKLSILHALRVDSTPALQELLTAFLQAQSLDSIDQADLQLDLPQARMDIGEPGAVQAILAVDFTSDQDQPLQLRGLFEFQGGRWRHIATVACLGYMFDFTEPGSTSAASRPASSLPQQEWIVRFMQKTKKPVQNSFDEITSRSDEIRFRLRGGLLWPLIHFESSYKICPLDPGLSATCSLTSTQLNKATLLDEKGRHVPGFVLATVHGGMPARRGLPNFGPPTCAAYLWNPSHFAYEPSPLKPLQCGDEPAPRAKPVAAPVR